jgi:hypothetical protein
MNRIKGKELHNHLKRCRKSLDKIQHCLMVKTLKRLGLEGTYLNIIKAIHDKSKVKREKMVSNLSTFVQYST